MRTRYVRLHVTELPSKNTRNNARISPASLIIKGCDPDVGKSLVPSLKGEADPAYVFGGFGHSIFSVGGALLFSGYILYDTSVIMHHMGPDDYVMAAISLYLDIINLFLYLLEILRMLQGGSD